MLLICPKRTALGFFMPITNDPSPFEPEIVMPKLTKSKAGIFRMVVSRKKLIVGIIFLIVVAIVVKITLFKPVVSQNNVPKPVVTKIEKNYEFQALNNQSKPLNSTKVKLSIVNAEKTYQVLVNEKVFTSKNNKMFLILNLELRNDNSNQVNIFPGDLVRISYDGNDDRKFAPDLHNNLVSVAAISTKLDRVGFVIPETSKDIKIYVGELDGKKDTISVNFQS